MAVNSRPECTGRPRRFFVGGRACFKAGLNEFANGADINGAAGFKTG
jgi:hypothetical protein